MDADPTTRGTLVDQVLEEMFTSIEGRDEFDAATVGKLRRLAEMGNLSKEKQVLDAIAPIEGNQDETANA